MCDLYKFCLITMQLKIGYAANYIFLWILWPEKHVGMLFAIIKMSCIFIPCITAIFKCNIRIYPIVWQISIFNMMFGKVFFIPHARSDFVRVGCLFQVDKPICSASITMFSLYFLVLITVQGKSWKVQPHFFRRTDFPCLWA